VAEAYRIAIGITLTDQVSGILGVLRRDFMRTGEAAEKLKKELAAIKLLALTGGAITGFGMLLARGLWDSVKPAREYNKQLALMNQSSMTLQQRQLAIAAAWRVSSSVMQTTPTQNIASIMELRQVFGGTDEGFKNVIGNLETIQKLTVLLSAYGENPKDGAYSVAKALEMHGATKTPAEFNLEADEMMKAIGGSHGRVTPTDFLQAMKYGRVAAQGWDNDFVYTILPTLIQEMKARGGSGGVSGGPGNPLMSAYAAIVGGTIPQKSVKFWEDLNLLDKSKEIYSKGGTLRGIKPGAVKGWSMFQQNPYEWVSKYLLPAFEAKHLSPAQEQQAIQTLFPNRTASFVMAQMALQRWKFDRDIPIYKGQQGLEGYRQMLHDNPEMAFQAAQAQWTRLQIVIGGELLPVLIPAIEKLASVLAALSDFGRVHPDLLKGLVLGLGGLAVAAMVAGPVLMLVAALKALRVAALLAPGAVATAARNLPGAVVPGAGRPGLIATIARPAIIGWALGQLGMGINPIPEYGDPAEHWRGNYQRPPGGYKPMEEWAPVVNWFKGLLEHVNPFPPAYGDERPGGLLGGDRGVAKAAPTEVSLTGTTTLNGTVVLNLGEFGEMVAKMVAKGISRAATGGASGSGARPDLGHPLPHPSSAF